MTLSVEGTNTHGLQIHVKQYQGCSRAGKSRCCPKWDLLAEFNVHSTHQEIRALSWVRRAHGKFISSKHQWTKWQSQEAEFSTGALSSLGLVEFARVFSFLVRKEPATETRPGLRSGAAEKRRNNSAALPLRDAVIHSKEQIISAGARSCKIKNSHKAQGSLRHMGRGEIPPPKPHVFDFSKDKFSLTLKSRAVYANVRKPLDFNMCQIHCFG